MAHCRGLTSAQSTEVLGSPRDHIGVQLQRQAATRKHLAFEGGTTEQACRPNEGSMTHQAGMTRRLRSKASDNLHRGFGNTGKDKPGGGQKVSGLCTHLHDDAASRRTADGDIEEDLGVNHLDEVDGKEEDQISERSTGRHDASRETNNTPVSSAEKAACFVGRALVSSPGQPVDRTRTGRNKRETSHAVSCKFSCLSDSQVSDFWSGVVLPRPFQGEGSPPRQDKRRHANGGAQNP